MWTSNDPNPQDVDSWKNPAPEFVNVKGVQESISPAYVAAT